MLCISHTPFAHQTAHYCENPLLQWGSINDNQAHCTRDQTIPNSASTNCYKWAGPRRPIYTITSTQKLQQTRFSLSNQTAPNRMEFAPEDEGRSLSPECPTLLLVRDPKTLVLRLPPRVFCEILASNFVFNLLLGSFAVFD